MMDKKELRSIIRNKKRQFTAVQLRELSLDVLSRLKTHEKFKLAQCILLYASLPDEVDTHDLLDELLKEGKEVLLPEVIDNSQMRLRVYSGKQDLREGSFHILEPIGKIYPESRYKEIEVGVIPGMSFDKNGNRLGRGKGYYDRLLKQMPNLYKIGICFDFQKTENVPVEANDIVMNEII